jgi:glycerophosphoryl diester phosphodiesterase
MNYSKLLSHRLRGFSDIEHSVSALENACMTDVPYLELDTRVSADGDIYVFHDPVFVSGDVALPFSTTPSDVLNRSTYPNGESLLPLKTALEIFSQRTVNSQKLCIDIKDFGFEEGHLALVRDFDLESHVCFISWIPQSLSKLRMLGTICPLILSHWNMHRFLTLGQLLTEMMKRYVLCFKNYVLIGKSHALTDLGSFMRGYQHTLIARELPSELKGCLTESRGGICVHSFLVSRNLLTYCRREDLQLWTFSVDNTIDYQKYARIPEINVVFCDDAPALMNDLRQG